MLGRHTRNQHNVLLVRCEMTRAYLSAHIVYKNTHWFPTTLLKRSRCVCVCVCVPRAWQWRCALADNFRLNTKNNKHTLVIVYADDVTLWLGHHRFRDSFAQTNTHNKKIHSQGTICTLLFSVLMHIGTCSWYYICFGFENELRLPSVSPLYDPTCDIAR